MVALSDHQHSGSDSDSGLHCTYTEIITITLHFIIDYIIYNCYTDLVETIAKEILKHFIW